MSQDGLFRLHFTFKKKGLFDLKLIFKFKNKIINLRIKNGKLSKIKNFLSPI